ncbi:site-specific DNA-methyltransferase [Leucobacter weissii]|uniref:Methyltransferase n=1 Tax=Leucobacter weissii TaxID=1983706 RepID=A0A939SCA1_9MICO|nr:site-specific DNA-methyltransferase [Leucobacter weissii]MBO1902245.1 site-specific DNA-methyltransferase [Leucobacter weissii]
MLQRASTTQLLGSPEADAATESTLTDAHRITSSARVKLIHASIGVEPYFSDEDFVLFNMDSLDLMSRLQSSPWDLTVTSPPYNIGKEYEATKSLDEYISWSKQWMSLVYDTTNSNGTFWLNVGYTPLHEGAKALPLAYLLWNLTDFQLVQEVVWHYGAGVAGRKFYSPRNEKFLWFVRNLENYTFNLDEVRDPNVKYPNQFKNGRRKVNSAGKNPTDVWSFPKVTSGRNRSSVERTPHPAQFPEAVIERVVLASSNRGDLVFDPFLGSGTTAVVASGLGRVTVGSELREDYCELAVNRYLSAKEKRSSQLDLQD